MVFLKYLKNATALSTTAVILSLLKLVHTESILDSRCEYFCNIQGKKYDGNTISKNIKGITLREHAIQKGSSYEYYFPCCNGELTAYNNINVIDNKLKIWDNVNVTMTNTHTYMDTDTYCSTYCAIDLETTTAYFKYSEEMTLTNFARKYANQYTLFTFCCDGDFDSDRMTFSHDEEEFSLNASFFHVDENSKTQVKNIIKEMFINDSCDYYCNVKNKSIISIKESNGLGIMDYAEKMIATTGSTYDSYTKCCDGKMKNRSNVPLYNAKGTVSFYEDLSVPFIFEYINFNQKCNYYCGFNNKSKTVTLFNTSETVAEAAKNRKNSYDYVTFCCKGESDIKGNLVTINANGEERAIEVKNYKYVPSNISTTGTNNNPSTNTNSNTNTNTNTSNNIPVSKNWRCGAKYGRCPDGYCCSEYNYCGKSPDHCGKGCLQTYGICT